MKYYFVADVHLGLQVGDVRAREQRFVRWLDEVKRDATAIFLLGDIFDFWFEYKTVVPRGFVRTLGKLAEITDSGIPVHFFVGNHDLWLLDYLPTEAGITVHREPLELTLGTQRFYLAHGNYVGVGTNLLYHIFTNKILQICFRALHPRWGMAFGHWWSRHNRLAKGLAVPFEGEKEFLLQFAKVYAKTHAINQFIFGHRHTPVQCDAGEKSQFTLLGEWIEGGEYAVFDGTEVVLHKAEF